MNLVDIRIVYINRLFHASIEKVFDAWLQPKLIRQWLFKKPGTEIIELEVDPKVEGKFRITTLSSAGKVVVYFGAFQQFVRPNLLLFTLESPEYFPGVSLVTVDLQPTKTGCELNFTQTGVEPELVEDGWRQMFENLENFVGEGKRKDELQADMEMS
ncbi:MAG: SRPBCC domain-containing protein [Bacteroidota bacterium]|nr:SRPBCC domain-containing protein [Bacteroidota bacterium]